MTKQNLMVDIETLGRNPGAAIISIGAVLFDEEGLGEEFYAEIDPVDCQAHGLTIDAGTLRWWLSEQSEEAADVIPGGRPLEEVLVEFGTFAMPCRTVWAKSPIFDVAILERAYEAVGVEAPWDFWQTRDVRTVMSLRSAEELPHGGTKHNALDDAKAQARNVAASVDEVR